MKGLKREVWKSVMSDRALERDRRLKRVFVWMTGVYVCCGVILAAAYAAMGEMYLAAQSLGTIAALWAVFAVMRLIGIKPVYSYYAVITGFMFASYTLGVACEWYKTLPGYDKLLHMMSGTFTMMLALPLFYALKAGHRVEGSDCQLAVGFCVMTALAVAGVWEMAEYALGLITPLDPQCVEATGVADTMKDMLVCTLGALMGVPPLVRLYRTGEGGILYSQIGVFIERNLEGCGETNE